MEDMIRDRLVCGMWNTKIQQCCLVETELNFDRALKIASAVERNKKNVSDIEESVWGK